MSKASSGTEQFWKCNNPECTSSPPIPLSLGSQFPACPYCLTPQPKIDSDNGSSLQRPPLHPDLSTSTGHGVSKDPTKVQAGSQPMQEEQQSQTTKTGESGSDNQTSALNTPKDDVGVESGHKQPLPDSGSKDNSSESASLPKDTEKLTPNEHLPQSVESCTSTGVSEKGNNDDKLGPPCQYCTKNLLSPTARICEHCTRGQRPTSKVSHVSTTATVTVTPKLDLPKIFGNIKQNSAAANFNTGRETNMSTTRTYATIVAQGEVDGKKNDRKRSASFSGPGDVSSAKQFKQSDGHSTDCESSMPKTPKDLPKLSTKKQSVPSKKKGNDPTQKKTEHHKKPDEPADPRNLPGLVDGKDKFIEVVFHVIVPKPHWGWDKTSKIFLRFGCKELGGWKKNVGHFEQRDIDDIFCEMTCGLKMKPELFAKAIPYKYYVFTPKSLPTKKWHEFLHDIHQLKGEYLNRFLSDKNESTNIGGVHHQYDSMAFPEDLRVVSSFTETLVTGINTGISKFKSFLGFKSGGSAEAKQELRVLSNTDMRYQCFLFYLEKYKNMLLSELSHGITISQFVEDVHRIFFSFLKIEVTYREDQNSNDTLRTIERKVLPMRKLFLEVLQPCVDRLSELSTEKQLAHSACMVWCIIRLGIPLTLIESFSPVILNCLCAQQPAVGSQQWQEYDYLCKLVPAPHHRHQLAETIKKFTVESVLGKQFIIDRLLSIPLVNFLSGTSQPYDDLYSNNYEQLIKMWNFLRDTFTLKELKSTVANANIRLVEHHFSALRKLFELDPFLLQAFIYICPVIDFSQLFTEIPPHVSTAWLSYMITVLEFKVCKDNVNTVLSWMSTIDKNLTADLFSSIYRKPFVVVVSALSFFTRCTIYLNSPCDHYLAVINASLSLTFKAMALYIESQGEKSIKDCNNVFTDIHKNLQQWIGDYNVVGGTMFGYRVHWNVYSRCSCLQKCGTEVKIWRSLLTVKSTNAAVTERWQTTIREILSNRIKKVPSEQIVGLLQFMEDNTQEHEILTNVIMDAALMAAENMLLKSHEDATDSFNKIAAANNNSKLLGSVFGTILSRKYPQLNQDDTVNNWITLDVLLEWDLWPSYIKIVQPGNESLLSEGLQVECQIACVCASTKFDDICSDLQQGDVSLHDLQKMKWKEVRLRRLCEAVSEQGGKKLSHNTVIGCLDQRLEEYEKFSARQQAYQDICTWIPNPTRVNGIDQLRAELKQDYGGCKIKDIISKMEDGSLKLSCFDAAKPLDPFVDHFSIMMTSSSNLFLAPLEQNMKQVLRRTVTIADIHPQIWLPTFEDCRKLLHDLAGLQMRLAFLNQHLKPFASSLQSELQKLAAAMRKCSQPVPDFKQALSKVREYWRICEYQDGAEVFLDLKKVLNLDGDFSLIQKFAANLETSMKDETLASIEPDLVKAGEFLKEITDTPARKDCLKMFVKCQNIVEWLRKSTKSVNDIQGFVTVALATGAGGEGDLATDRLSSLRIVGSGFASLIYDVPKTAGYTELMQRCTSLWDSLKKTPTLPKCLEDCNKDISWYQSAKETQGSVETTSYGQMTNILKYGTYSVGLGKNAKTVHDLITVTLTQQYQKLHKTEYSLDELRDLESKLVLICGSKADTRAEVDHYLDLLHSATRIAELLLDLQRAGDVTYSTHTLEFRCAVYNVQQPGVKDPQLNKGMAKKGVSDLQEYTRRLDAQLVEWKKTVDTARGDYYELNYFTTLQLLELRKELGCLSQPSTSAPSIRPSVIMLLKSVSPCVTSTVISESLLAALHGQEAAPVDQDIIPVTINTEIRKEDESETEPMEASTTCSIEPVPLSPKASPMAKPSLPALTYEELDEKQQGDFTMLVKSLGFTKNHVLRAFQECGLEANLYDIEEWCEKNVDQLPVIEQEGDDEALLESGFDITYDSEGSESEPEDSSMALSLPRSGGSTEQEDHPPVLDISCSIRTIERQVVDENHPDVQELVGAGYGLQAAVQAVDQFRDIEKAMKYLDDQERGEIEAEGPAPKFAQSVSREENERNEVDLEGIREYYDPNANKNHLELDQLGRVLQAISSRLPGAVSVQRTFKSGILKAGLPNLLVTFSDNVLRSVLALYTDDTDHPLPTQEEVLLCTNRTTAEEVSLLWRRAIGDPGYRRIFCLAHAEKLSYQVCDASLRSLAELSQGKQDYRLVVICSKEDEDKSHIISRLHNYKRPVVPRLVENQCREYLMAHFTRPNDMGFSAQTLPTVSLHATIVDPDKSCVRVVSSTRSGMGKSLYIRRRAQELTQAISNQDIHITIPIHGPMVTSDTLLDFFNEHTDREACTLYHLDIAPRVLSEVDCLLFSLLILRGLSDSRGHVWKTQSSQLYMVEVTLPEDTANSQDFQTLNLLSLLPTVQCVSPLFVQKQELGAGMLGMDNEEFSGPTIQRVYQYLKKHAAAQNLDTFSYLQGCVEGNVRSFLKIILSKCGVRDPSWAEVHHFTKFLNIQLHSCESSVFCNEALVGDVMSGLKGFVVKFMIRMSQDFSTPSLEGVLARENDEDGGEVAGDNDQLEQYQIVRRRQWEQSSHPYIFFNNDGESITFVGFRVTQTGDLIDPENMVVIERAIMTPQLYKGLKWNKVNFDEDHRGWTKREMINRVATVMGLKFLHDPDESYVLTTDNLIKMLAIQMRFRCDIPVVIMGETGCGKTRLIRYMCDLARHGRDLENMLILKIHGGITDQDVVDFMKDAEKVADKNKATDSSLSTVVFFDEANTTESIGLIKEIMCDRRVNGRAISPDLKFIAACNPYRKHSYEMIKKLETAGLGFYVKETETEQKLGKIPLRQLVYRVLDLPPSMTPLVYDFGQLNTGTEHDYTSQIVKDHVNRHPELCNESPAIIPAISAVLAASQKFMRDQDNECSFVSLRDVERAMIVFEYFYEKMNSVFAPLMDQRAREEYDDLYAVDEEDEDKVALPPPPVSSNTLTRALLLSLSVCYHARLQDREPYEELISRSFRDPLGLPGGAKQFRNEIKWCQEGLLDNMVLGPNIAKNAALRENVFMMAVCIELRIPLFLVGKPGSSKSLAKSIIQDSMHGQDSKSLLLKKFKEVHMFSYQCSQLSTPESVIEVFKSAEKFQAKQDLKQYVSVVVLDEVGLAEDSPSLPLKALHPLLEDGTEGSGKNHQNQTVERERRVAFIGISNWALDPAKMNRGVMVTRGAPGSEELKLSAFGICSTKDKDPVREQLKIYFEPLSCAYLEICEKQKRQFFGLRDYYSLIKMLYWMCEKTLGHRLSRSQLEHAIRRNFGGLKSDELDPMEEFRKIIHLLNGREDLSEVDSELHSTVISDCSSLGLIKASLNTKDTTWHGENRYLLFLTENYAALDILKHYLNDGGERVEDDDDLITQPYILFGSSFPKDKEYTQVCRNINQIKICMETGRTVILLNLENLYESLYDVLNQYYMYYGGVRYVDLGLQTHRVKCRVHKNFKLILIAEKDTVYNKFPTPLINRLEKHFVLASSVLEGWQHEVLRELEEWIKDFSVSSDSRGNQFKNEGHAFIGYQKDTPAAVIFQATNQLSRLVERPKEQECLRLQKAGIFCGDLYNISENDEGLQRSQMVLRLSQFLLLQTAADDAVIRLQNSSLSREDVIELQNLYFKHQHHRSIREFLKHECREDQEIFMQVTTHSPLMTQEELWAVAQSLSMGCAHFDLHEFDTELDFSNKIGPNFLREENEDQLFLVVIQCDSGHLNHDLIACARYRVCDEAIKAKAKDGSGCITHILFVIRLPQQEVKSQFVGFQGDPWISVHIDDLRPSSEVTVIPEQALTAKISEIFIGELEKPGDPFQSQPLEGVRSEDEVVESGESREEREMSLSAEYDKHETDSHKEGDMSEDSSLNMEESGAMDIENNQSLFTVRKEVLEDSVSLPRDIASSEQPNLMEVQDIEGTTPEQLHTSNEPVHNDALLPVEEMQTEQSGCSAAITSEDDFQPMKDEPVTPIPLATPITPHSVHIESEGGADENGPETGLPVVKTGEDKSFHAQYRRLHGCVQAAVSLLKDSEENRSMLRIQKLMTLVPNTTLRQLDELSFYAILVKFIHQALKQREEVRVDETDWVLMEAMDGKKLQSGGTFRNVLARCIDEVITPYFAELIAHVDQNRNLDLLDAGDQTTPISLFWLEMFNVSCGRIDFSSPAKGKTDIRARFHCQLPFSWFVREEVDDQRTSVLGTSQTLQESFNATLIALSETKVGEVLSRVSEEDVEGFYKQYLQDFVRYMHQSSFEGDLGRIEYKLIMDALDAMTHNPDLCSMDGHESLPRKIVALHLVYSQCSSKVLQFGQLVQHRPGVLHSLSSIHPSVGANWDFTLHLSAVQRVLESNQEEDPSNQTLHGLNPPLHKEKQLEVTQNILRWVNHIRLSQNIIDTILRSSVTTEAAVKARVTWQKVRALQIFAEKVYLPHYTVHGMHFIIRRLEITLKRHSNFLRKETVDGVKQLLNSMFNSPRIKVDAAMDRKLRRDCNQFFIEIVSRLCFGGREAPEPDLVKTLLDTVLHDMGTSKLSPYDQPDNTPTIRSFLLQLLLEKEHDQVEEYLSDYFDKSLRVIGGELDKGLCLLCIQCFEDALCKRISIDHQSQSHEAALVLEESYLALQERTQANEPQVSLQYLQSVAGVRFGLCVAAEQLRNGRSDDHLLRVVCDLCVDPRINVIDLTGRLDTTGPVLYLIKLLIRQFGYPCLKAVCKDHPWVVPEELRREEEDNSIDPFVLYGKDYVDVRSAVNTVVFTKKTDELMACLQDGCKPSLLTFAIYQKVTLSRASREPAKHVPEEVLQTLDTFFQECTGLPYDVKHVVRLLLGNQQGGHLAQLAISPYQSSLCRIFSGIVVHTVSVILSTTSEELLLPFLNMLTNPTALEDAYLPTMTEDTLPEVRAAAGGNFYKCPNGHTYNIGDCGQPWVTGECNECKAPIGGSAHKLLDSNKLAHPGDTTKKGYDLGLPELRSTNPERERHLSASAVCVVRALMHSALVWASCNNQAELVEIAKITNGQVLPGNLPEFFWLHLEKDMECLGRSTRRGVEECAMIVHLVLHRILTSNPPTSPTAGNAEHLQSKDARKQWEQLFSSTYINPVLAHLDTAIKRAQDTVVNDNQQDHDQLFYLAYEKVKVDESKLQAHLWTFRQQINLEHLQRGVQAVSTKKIPVLDAFLKAEPSLRATQYLPDIVKLQRFLFDMFNKRMEKEKAETLTIREFLKELKEKFNQNTKNECQERIESLKRAWVLVRHKLKHHIEEQYLLSEVTPKTPLIYLIPTTEGEGKCTTALVNYLVITHNNFIDHCRTGTVISEGAMSATAVWREHKVPITHLHHCHMMEYEQQLQSIILSHCHYSLAVGKGQEIKYDLPALEKHILDRFIYGKPVIQVDMNVPSVAYRKDIFTKQSFLEIRRKVKPQVPLDQRHQQDILMELRTPDKLRESLDVVDIVLGLLSSGGGNPQVTLKRFIGSRKMSKKSFSSKAKEHCTLSHIISLWETLSVELARQLWDNDQEPFEAIPDGYSRELGSDKHKLDKCLRTFDLSVLLGVLFEFIEIHVKQITNMKQTDYMLVDALDDYWDKTKQTPPPLNLDNFRRDFPSSITVDQAVATWKHVADYKVRRH